MPNKDQIKGVAKQVKGSVKDKVGELTGNRKMEIEGEAEKAAGKVQKKVGDAKQAVKKAVS